MSYPLKFNLYFCLCHCVSGLIYGAPGPWPVGFDLGGAVISCCRGQSHVQVVI